MKLKYRYNTRSKTVLPFTQQQQKNPLPYPKKSNQFPIPQFYGLVQKRKNVFIALDSVKGCSFGKPSDLS